MFKNIHRKPKAVREQYAFWSAAIITACIGLVWIVSLQYRFDDGLSPSNVVEEEQRGAFSQFLGEARDRAAAAFGAAQTDTATSTGTTTDARETTATSTPHPAFEFLPGTRATTSESASGSPREVRIQPVSAQGTSTTDR